MFKRKVIPILIATLAFVALFGLVTAQMAQKHSKKQLVKGKTLGLQYRTPQQDQSMKRQQEEATPVEEGAMTEKERKHGQLFKGYEDVTKGKKLREIMDKTGGDVSVGRLIGNMIVPTSFSLDQYISDLTCKADVVVIGKLKKKASQLNGEGTFTFTEYEINVEEVLKNHAADPIQANGNLTVVRSGGSIKLNGRIVTATDFAERPLEKGGRYLLFLRFVPETGAYRSFSGGNNLTDDSFRLVGNQLVQVSDSPLPFGPNSLNDATAFISKVRTNTGCNQGGDR
jgi:hypothetical protein